MPHTGLRVAHLPARLIAPLALAVLLVLAASVTLAPAFVAPVRSSAHAAEGSAATGHRIARGSVTVKSARFVSSLGNVQGALNQCRGPVAWNSRGEGAPWLLFEHDYCGGAWALSVRAGHVLK